MYINSKLPSILACLIHKPIPHTTNLLIYSTNRPFYWDHAVFNPQCVSHVSILNRTHPVQTTRRICVLAGVGNHRDSEIEITNCDGRLPLATVTFVSEYTNRFDI
jgi:hypothetical protein